MKQRARQKGFTIVELLIVIVVIGILAAITIVAYNGIQERARVARANSELTTLSKAIIAARISQDKTMFAITQYGYSVANQALYEQALDRIGAASGANLNALKAGDPWGNRYYIDENEEEFGVGDCRQDIIGVSPGRSGVPSYAIPFYKC